MPSEAPVTTANLLAIAKLLLLKAVLGPQCMEVQMPGGRPGMALGLPGTCRTETNACAKRG